MPKTDFLNAPIHLFGKKLTVADIGLLTILGVGGFVGYQYWVKLQKQDEFNQKFLTDDNAQQASALYVAINPSGISWMKNFDTTNTDSLFRIAATIKDFNKVATYYKTVSGGADLTSDLQSELTPAEYEKFLRILKGTETPAGYKYNNGDKLVVTAAGQGTLYIPSITTGSKWRNFTFKKGTEFTVADRYVGATSKQNYYGSNKLQDVYFELDKKYVKCYKFYPEMLLKKSGFFSSLFY